VDDHFNQMKRLLAEMKNDPQRFLAIQTLLILDSSINRLPGTADLSDRLIELSRRATIELESVVPWWAEMFVTAIRHDQARPPLSLAFGPFEVGKETRNSWRPWT
jgi:hypothetical protein